MFDQNLSLEFGHNLIFFSMITILVIDFCLNLGFFHDLVLV